MIWGIEFLEEAEKDMGNHWVIKVEQTLPIL